MAVAQSPDTDTTAKHHNSVKMNGQPNGSVQASGAGSRSSRAQRKKRKTYTGWIVNKSAKLFVWYALITVLFRCPSSSSDLTESSHRVCKAYFSSRDFISPYAQPYYDQHLAPHVKRAQPYVDQFNTKVYSPGYAAYQAYGAPRVADAQKFGAQQWEKTLKPQFEVAKQHAGKQYDATLGPQVKKVQDVVQPYYDQVSTSATDIWQLEILPVYRRAAPYAQKVTPYAQYAYAQGQQFAMETALPQAQYAGSTVWAFWTRQIWPKMRVLYGENVEPQLMRITERLSRYKDSKMVEAGVKSVELSSSAEAATSSIESAASVAASVSSSVSSTVSEATESPSSVSSSIAASEPTTESTTEIIPEPTLTPAERFENDLANWEAVCSTAVEEGAEHLKEHIEELTESLISKRVNGTGSALVVQLEETARSVIEEVKLHIATVVSEIPDDADDKRITAAHEALTGGIRSSGQNVKKSAQAVREWRQKFIVELDDLVAQALESALETVDGIREIRLQEIGRKYHDQGLPHKMWSKYNALKKATKVWRDDVEKVIAGNKDIAKAKDAAEELEHRGMGFTEDAAMELARLKDVGIWKATAGDASEDFDTKAIPAAAERARKRVVEKVADASEAILGASETEQGAFESVTSVVAEKASEAVTQISEALPVTSTVTMEKVSSEASETVKSAGNEAKRSAASVVSAASEAVVGSSDLSDTATAAASSISSAISSKASDITSTKTVGPEGASKIAAARSMKEAGEKKAASASKSASSVAEAARSAASSMNSDIYDGASSASDAISSSLSSASSTASEVIPDASDVSTASAKASKKVYGGAMAEVIVESRDPIMDQDVEDEAVDAADSVKSQLSDTANEVAAAASSRYSEAASQASAHYEAAKSRLSVQLSGTPEPIHKRMFASADSAYSDSIAVASQRLQDAVGAVKSANPLATPTQGAFESISSIASLRLAEGVSAASAQLQSAKAAVGAEPTPAHQQYLAAAQRQYYIGLGMAHDQYSSFVDAASSAVGATPTAGYQAYVAAAQATYSAALAAARNNMESVLAAAAAGGPAASKIPSLGDNYDAAVEAAQSQLSAASSHASVLFYGTAKGQVEQATEAAGSVYNDAASAASSAIYGGETPWTEAMASQASENWEAIISQASEKVYGTPAPFAEAMMSNVGEYAAQATELGAVKFEALQSLFSELTADKDEGFVESMRSRLNSAYSTGAPDMASIASSYANEAYASASSVVQAVFTPPAALDNMMDQVNSQLDAAVNAASEQYYGSTKGMYESATEAAASAYSDAASQVSEAVYGTDAGYVEAAQASASDIGASASKVISEALFGTPTGNVEAAQNSAASVYDAMTSAASEQAAAVSSSVSSALHGEEETYMEGMQAQVAAAVANAQSRMSEFGVDASKLAAENLSQATDAAIDAASTISSAAAAATDRVKDEL